VGAPDAAGARVRDDLLEYEDIFDGSHVIQAKVDEIMAGAREEIARVQDLAARSPRSRAAT